MKKCPVCQQIYHDDETNFCLNDGANLIAVRTDDAPTVFMNPARPTEQNWSNYETSAAPPSAPVGFTQPHGALSQTSEMPSPQNQTLAVISLTLGVLGLVLMCCQGGIPLGAGALITGYLAHQNVKKDPISFGGNSMAIGGMVTGAVSLLIGFGFLLVAIFSK